VRSSVTDTLTAVRGAYRRPRQRQLYLRHAAERHKQCRPHHHFSVADDTISRDDAVFTALSLVALVADAFTANTEQDAIAVRERVKCQSHGAHVERAHLGLRL
jgi:hypothetical protein